MHNKGYLITFEGNDGSGKTTQIELLKETLKPMGKSVVFTREPGGTKIAESIRGILLDTKNTDMSPMTELLLYGAARAQHYETVIKPALEAGKVVFCDRYIHSSHAYQGGGRVMDSEFIAEMNFAATEGKSPDFTIWLRSEPAKALMRKNDDVNRMDMNGLSFNMRVEEVYKSFVGESFVGIPVGTIEETQVNIREALIGNLKWHALEYGEETLFEDREELLVHILTVLVSGKRTSNKNICSTCSNCFLEMLDDVSHKDGVKENSPRLICLLLGGKNRRYVVSEEYCEDYN